MTANAAMLDQAVDHAINVLRFERGVVFRMIATLNRQDARLMAALAEALLAVEPSDFTIERLEAQLQSVREINSSAYEAVLGALEPELSDMAKAEIAGQAAMMRKAIPPAIQLRFPIASVSWQQVYAAALARPFQGRLLRDWVKHLSENRMRMLRETIRAGFVDGLTSADIIRKLRGTKAQRFEDGVLNRSRRGIAAIVQTALSHTANVAREAGYKANADLIKGIRWVSTLDGRTTNNCRVRDQKQYTTDHKPVGHKIPWLQGPGAIHINCRSTSVPILKSWREIGIDMDDLPPSTRASMDGQVPADMTYAQWFAKQSAERQDEIVGKKRGALYRAGKVRFEQFSDDKGEWLTLDELMRKIAP